MKIKHYVTAFANDLVKLDREVNELLAKGYQPYGDPYISDAETSESKVDRFLACQAMVSFEEPLPPLSTTSLI